MMAIILGYVAFYVIVSGCATLILSWTPWFTPEECGYLSLFSTVFAIVAFLFTVITTIVNLFHTKKAEHESAEAIKRIERNIERIAQGQPIFNNVPTPPAVSPQPIAPDPLYIYVNWLWPILAAIQRIFGNCPCTLTAILIAWGVWAFICSVSTKGVIYAHEIKWLFRMAVTYHYVLLSLLIVVALASAIRFIP